MDKPATDLTARVTELASRIEAELREDETLAQAATPGPWAAETYIDEHEPVGVETLVSSPSQASIVAGLGLRHDAGSDAAHIARHDPDSTLRRVKATRDLVAAILREEHEYVPGDEFYSCSQAVDPYPGDSGEPGSGCSDPERAGKPCDCGRDMRVARLLGIILTEWEAKGDH